MKEPDEEEFTEVVLRLVLRRHTDPEGEAHAFKAYVNHWPYAYEIEVHIDGERAC